MTMRSAIAPVDVDGGGAQGLDEVVAVVGLGALAQRLDARPVAAPHAVGEDEHEVAELRAGLHPTVVPVHLQPLPRSRVEELLGALAEPSSCGDAQLSVGESTDRERLEEADLLVGVELEGLDERSPFGVAEVARGRRVGARRAVLR